MSKAARRSDPDDAEEVMAAQLGAYVSQLWLITIGNIGVALLLAAFLWSVVDGRRLLAWLGLLVFVNGIRIVQIPALARRSDSRALRKGIRMAVLLTSLTGLLWGASAWFLFPESLAHQLLLMLTLAGFAAGAMTLVGSIPHAYPLFILLLLTPLILVLRQSPIGAYRDVSLLLIVYVLYLLTSYRTHRQLFLDSVRLRIRLQRLADQDPLTRIPNRRYFDARFPQECRRANRERVPLSLVLLDIDHFKRINDLLGHQVGDQVLQDVAQAIQGAIRRPGDFVARIGGEEFAIVLPATDAKGAETVVGEIRKALDQVLLPAGSALHENRLTASMGIAVCDDRQCASDALFAAADAALYRAKQGGRDTWRFHRPSMDAA